MSDLNEFSEQKISSPCKQQKQKISHHQFWLNFYKTASTSVSFLQFFFIRYEVPIQTNMEMSSVTYHFPEKEPPPGQSLDVW